MACLPDSAGMGGPVPEPPGSFPQRVPRQGRVRRDPGKDIRDERPSAGLRSSGPLGGWIMRSPCRWLAHDLTRR